MKTNIDRVYSKMPQKKYNFENQKVELMIRENDVDNASEIFRDKRGELDFILNNKLPDVIVQLNSFSEIIENSENELYKIIDLYKSVMSEYESKANDLGINPEEIVDYRFLETKIFEAEQQLEIASELKNSINNI